jgi:hypothetical protein
MWMSDSLRMEAMIGIVSSSESLKLKIKNKSLGVSLVNGVVIRNIHSLGFVCFE